MKPPHFAARRLFTLLLPLAFLTITTQAQETGRINLESLDKLASKAVNTERREEKGKGGDSMVYASSFEFSQAGEYTEAHLQEIRAQLKAPGWSQVMKISDKDSGGDENETAEIYVFGKTAGSDTYGGMTIIATEPRELTVVNIVGKGNIDAIVKQIKKARLTR